MGIRTAAEDFPVQIPIKAPGTDRKSLFLEPERAKKLVTKSQKQSIQSYFLIRDYGGLRHNRPEGKSD
jgi:hypothetical protein